SMIIPGDDDGKVSIDRARVEGMADFLVVNHSHTFIMKSEDVIAQIAAFLQAGQFNHSADPHFSPD
ncbi:MAG: alpha/beta hydrolase, partial [Gammaproteobacteria bacterium]